jgi:hypothetical protein
MRLTASPRPQAAIERLRMRRAILLLLALLAGLLYHNRFGLAPPAGIAAAAGALSKGDVGAALEAAAAASQAAAESAAAFAKDLSGPRPAPPPALLAPPPRGLPLASFPRGRRGPRAAGSAPPARRAGTLAEIPLALPGAEPPKVPLPLAPPPRAPPRLRARRGAPTGGGARAAQVVPRGGPRRVLPLHAG